jgi:transcriptional antiterminator RfaH
MVQKIQRSQMRLTSEPMFPRYVFVAGDAFFETKGSSPIRSTMGVHELVHFGMRPAVIQLELLQAIFERQKAHHKAPSSAFKSGDKVALINGPLAGLESIYQAQSGEERSMILLNLLSRPTKVQVATNLLTKIA